MKIQTLAASLFAAAAATAFLLSCGPMTSKGKTLTAPEHPTYYQDVAPILSENCTGCHVAGSIAPFTLDTYDDAKLQAVGIKFETAARRMPPWGPQNTGTCKIWKDARWLSDIEIETLKRWADDGAPAGTVAAIPTPAPTPALAHVDATLDMAVSYTPQSAGGDVYRCFLADPGITANTYITGYHVMPGARDIVHHVIVYSVSDQGATEAASKDALDAEPGYECFGTANVAGESWALAWAPGGDVGFYPATTGVPLKAGQKVVMQVHYNLAAGSKADQTRIDLQLDSTVTRPAYIVPVLDNNFSLAKGTGMASDSVTYALAQLPVNAVTLWGLAPHMHLLGRAAAVSTTHANGQEECLLDQPHYDFRWQQLYQYDAPITLIQSDSIKVTCTWDTTNAVNDPTTWGENTNDEMCIAVAYITAGPAPTPAP